MALTREEEDRLKFSGEGTGIKRTGPPTFMETIRAADAALGKGINYVGENLPKVPKKLWDATTINRSGVSGEVNPVEATGRFLSRLASNAPNTFGGVEMGASAGQAPSTKAQNNIPNRPTNNVQELSSADIITLQPYGMKRTPERAPITTANSITTDGWTSTSDPSVYGGRRLSFGTPGESGAGTGYVSGPVRNTQSRERFLTEIAKRNQLGRGQVDGYSFEGSGADFAKFAQKPTRSIGQDGNTVSTERPIYQQIRDRAENSTGIKPPKYLGPESGLGWKTRLQKYKEDMDAYTKATGNKAMMDIEAMREAGAGQRSLLDAEVNNQRNQMEQQRFLAQYPGQVLDNQIKLDDLANRQEVGALRNQLRTLTPGTPEYDEIERRLATLSGKFGEQKEPNVQMIEEQLDPTDPSSPLVKRPVRINRDGSYSRMPESVAPTAVTAESIIQSDPLSAERYAKLSPEDKVKMIQEMNKRMAERQAQ